MIKLIVENLQGRYVRRRHEDGTSDPDSISNLALAPLKEEGLRGIPQGISALRKKYISNRPEDSSRISGELFFLRAIIVGPPEFFLIVMGVKTTKEDDAYMWKNVW